MNNITIVLPAHLHLAVGTYAATITGDRVRLDCLPALTLTASVGIRGTADVHVVVADLHSLPVVLGL